MSCQGWDRGWLQLLLLHWGNGVATAAATTTTKKKYVSCMKYYSNKQYKLRLNRTRSLRRARGTAPAVLWAECYHQHAHSENELLVCERFDFTVIIMSLTLYKKALSNSYSQLGMDWWMLAYGSKLDIVPKLASVIAIVSHFSFFRLILLLAVQQKLNWSHKK